MIGADMCYASYALSCLEEDLQEVLSDLPSRIESVLVWYGAQLNCRAFGIRIISWYKGPAIWREQFALWVLVWSISLESLMVWKLEVQKMWICFCIQTSQTGLRLSRLWITMCKRSRYRFKRNPCRCKQICWPDSSPSQSHMLRCLFDVLWYKGKAVNLGIWHVALKLKLASRTKPLYFVKGTSEFVANCQWIYHKYSYRHSSKSAYSCVGLSVIISHPGKKMFPTPFRLLYFEARNNCN